MDRGAQQSVGRWGETQAALFLERHGFAVIEHNFHTTRGEIDLVAKKGDEYYFVEVKTRRDGPWANDLAVTFTKKQRFRKAVDQYCLERDLSGCGLEFATVLVIILPGLRRVRFRWVRWTEVI